MERHEFDGTFEFGNEFLERNEGTIVSVNVGLINFICHEDEIFLLAQVDDFFHNGLLKTSSRGIAGVYDDKGTRGDAFGASFFKCGDKVGNRKRPIRFFTQIILHGCPFEERQGGGIEWIVRDRNYYASL